MKPVVTVVAMTIGVIGAFEAVAQEERPVAGLIAAVHAQVEQQCALGRKRMSSSTRPFEIERASAFVKLNCDCLPAEIERAATDLGAGKEAATTTQAAFTSRFKMAVDSCVARLVRSDFASRCAGESESTLGVTDKKAYCGCVTDRVNILDDQTIATVAATKYKNFQDKVQARIKAEPEPVPVPTALDGIEAACRQSSQ